MNAADALIAIRDAVYTAINTKKTVGTGSPATQFTLTNSFDLKKTWRPYTNLDKLASDFPHGRVYVIGSRISDMLVQSRSNMVLNENPVMVGYQRIVTDIDDVAEIDDYVKFVGELVDVCRLDTDPNLQDAFNRIEFIRDPDGLPLSFILLRDAFTFEAYFTAYYHIVLQGYDQT